MDESRVVRNIGCLLTMTPSEDPAGLTGAAVAIRDGTVVWTGPERDLPADLADLPALDAGGGLVVPGLVECHTHLVFAGTRADEFSDRCAGTTYEEIARRGGGIARTVRAVRDASREELAALALPRLRRFLRAGVTTVEVKSGYGLSLEAELKILEVVRDLGGRTPVELVPTFLGAHAIPPEARPAREAHVDAIVSEWIPAVAEAGLARFCDVFCETVAFTVAESERILRAGLDAGLRPKVHAEQLGRFGGAALAAAVGAVSADHLDFASAEDLDALARAGTVAVLLPGCPVSLGRPSWPDARPFLAAGATVAVSTDFNPGSSPTQDLPLMASFAMAFCRLPLRRAWEAVTSSAAAALGLSDRVGRLAPGFQGDLVVYRDPDAAHPFYAFGGTLPAAVVKRGRVVVREEA